MNAALRISNKSTYTSWIRYFYKGEGRGKRVMVEALLSYWPSCFILLRGPEDRIDAYVFPLLSASRRGRSSHSDPCTSGHFMLVWTSATIILRARWGRYDVVTYVDTNFLQIFLCSDSAASPLEHRVRGGDLQGGDDPGQIEEEEEPYVHAHGMEMGLVK